ncbi:MAG: pilus assembly protein [Actinobacteria bacterium]|nr:pilus assembly protein [Actinomycetota bacterium]MBW3650765.1 pilus assembly protein [Actinomycetota bacterium]
MTTELVLVTPLILVLLLFVAYAGRVAGARNDTVGAARDAARSASLVRSPALADRAAADAAEATLADQRVTCAGGPVVDTDVTDFRPGGTVTVKVRCSLKLADLSLLGLRGGRDVTAKATEVIDRYRSEP